MYIVQFNGGLEGKKFWLYCGIYGTNPHNGPYEFGLTSNRAAAHEFKKENAVKIAKEYGALYEVVQVQDNSRD